MVITIKVYGGGSEVGRSCFEVKMNERRFLFDAGVKIHHDSLDFPESIPQMGEIQNVFISHVHLDHTGALPLLYAHGLRCPVYASQTTKNVLPILLKDSWKVANIKERVMGYRKSDIKKILNMMIEFPEKNNYAEFNVAGGYVKVIDAGHVPGSRAVYLNIHDKSVLYTGDISLTDMRLVPGADLERFPHADVLIIESTYGDREHPLRRDEEKRFFKTVDEILSRGGSVIIPTFAVGRSQEMLMLLESAGYFDEVPIYFEGMCKKITVEYLNHIDNVKLARAYNRAIMVESKEAREQVLKKQSIIVTTSGMLDGGPVVEYLKKINIKDGILLTGYQAEDTNGRLLLERGMVEVDDVMIKINCTVDKFDFSSHAGAEDLKKIIRKVNPKHVVLVHGDDKALFELAKYVRSTGAIAHVPKVGEKIHIAKVV